MAKQISRRGLVWFILTLVMLPLGVIALAVIYFLADPLQKSRLEKNGVFVTGRVTGVELDRHIHSGSRHPWIIRYSFETTEGTTTYGQARTWNTGFKKMHPVGGAIGVFYMPEKPSDNRPADIQDSMVPWYVYLIICAELFTGIIFYFVFRSVVSGARSLFVDGIAAKGKINSIAEARHINVGRRHPYNIAYSFTDPNTGREHESFMRSYSFDLAAKLRAGDEVAVVYDWENPGRSMIIL